MHQLACMSDNGWIFCRSFKGLSEKLVDNLVARLEVTQYVYVISLFKFLQVTVEVLPLPNF